ncbi:transposase [Streptomyces sp. NPDC002073]
MITDTLGLVLTVLVTAASVHDSVGGKQALTDLAAAHPSVTKVWADGGYQTSVIQHGAGLGIDVQVVQRPRVKGFQPLWCRHGEFGQRRVKADPGAQRVGFPAVGDARGVKALGNIGEPLQGVDVGDPGAVNLPLVHQRSEADGFRVDGGRGGTAAVSAEAERVFTGSPGLVCDLTVDPPPQGDLVGVGDQGIAGRADAVVEGPVVSERPAELGERGGVDEVAAVVAAFPASPAGTGPPPVSGAGEPCAFFEAERAGR